MICARIGTGPCYKNCNEICAGVRSLPMNWDPEAKHCRKSYLIIFCFFVRCIFSCLWIRMQCLAMWHWWKHNLESRFVIWSKPDFCHTLAVISFVVVIRCFWKMAKLISFRFLLNCQYFFCQIAKLSTFDEADLIEI